ALGGVGVESSLPVTGQPTLRSEPECSFTIFVDAVNGVVRQAVARREHGEPALVTTAKAVVCPHPQAALTVLPKHPDQISSKAVPGRTARKFSISQATQSAAAAADPEIAVTVGQDASCPVLNGEPVRLH